MALAEEAAGHMVSDTQRANSLMNEGVSPHHLQVSDLSSLSPSPSPLLPPNNSSSLSTTLATHVSIFMEHLFPVMPVVDEAGLLADCASPDSLPPSRLALLLALVAVTRLQLRLDQADESLVYQEEKPHKDATFESCTTGLHFLSAAEDVRQTINIADSMSEDAILTSFFLFVCYGNQEQHKKAWFYLNQSASMAILLELDIETAESIAGLAHDEIDRRRRIYWLLFISERTYALQRRMPVLLRRTVPKPGIFDSDHPIIMNDFVNHINLFEPLPPELYEWEQKTSGSTDLLHLPQRVIQALHAVQPQNSLLESQQFDTLITQHWLRVTMWRLICGIAAKFGDGSMAMPELSLPFDAGSSVMLSLASVSSASKNRHGISLEQKLFDIGTSLLEVTPSTTPSAMTLGPSDLFAAIVDTLRCIRGRESHLLPKLFQHSAQHLGCMNLAWGMDMQLSTAHFPARLQPAQCEELASPGALHTLGLDQSELEYGLWAQNDDETSLVITGSELQCDPQIEV